MTRILLVFSLLLRLLAGNAAAQAADSAAGPGDPPARLPGPALADSLALWVAEGFLRARLDSAGRPEKGPRYRIARVTWDSASPSRPAWLDLDPWRGRTLNRDNLLRLEAAVKKACLRRGFPFAAYALGFRPAGGEGSAEVTLALELGSAFAFGGFSPEGTRMGEARLTRLSLLEPGEIYDEGRLESALARLSRTGYFETVERRGLQRDSLRNLLYPVLSVPDYRGNQLSGIGGFDSEGGSGARYSGFLDIHLINLVGTARDLDLTLRISPSENPQRSRTEMRLAYFEPWLLGGPVGLHLRGSLYLEDSVYTESEGELEFVQDLDFRSAYGISLASQRNQSFFPTADGGMGVEESRAVSSGLSFTFDGRDRFPHPRRGGLYRLRLEGLRRRIGDSTFYALQTFPEGRRYLAFGRRLVLQLHAAAAATWPNRRRMNRGDLHPLGGASQLRGYREREFLTPAFAFGDVEPGWQLDPRSRVFVFLSPGYVVRREEAASSGWRGRGLFSYGAGLDLGSKDWEVGVSYGLNPERDYGDGFIHVKVTNRF